MSIWFTQSKNGLIKAMSTSRGAGIACNLHAIFYTILETFITAQNSGMQDNTTLILGGQQ
jgi:hypothetical protein